MGPALSSWPWIKALQCAFSLTPCVGPAVSLFPIVLCTLQCLRHQDTAVRVFLNTLCRPCCVPFPYSLLHTAMPKGPRHCSVTIPSKHNCAGNTGRLLAKARPCCARVHTTCCFCTHSCSPQSLYLCWIWCSGSKCLHQSHPWNGITSCRLPLMCT